MVFSETAMVLRTVVFICKSLGIFQRFRRGPTGRECVCECGTFKTRAKLRTVGLEVERTGMQTRRRVSSVCDRNKLFSNTVGALFVL